MLSRAHTNHKLFKPENVDSIGEHRSTLVAMKGAKMKKVAIKAVTRFDMCVSTLTSPLAGVLYTVAVLEKAPEKPQHTSRAHEAP